MRDEDEGGVGRIVSTHVRGECERRRMLMPRAAIVHVTKETHAHPTSAAKTHTMSEPARVAAEWAAKFYAFLGSKDMRPVDAML